MRDIPVAICFFNRPDCTLKVFNKIAKWKPRDLILVSDGPRSGKNERDLILSLRNEIETNIRWECEVTKLYSESNEGCSKKISTSLQNIFSKFDYCAILEDDCMPSDSFYDYCLHTKKLIKENITTASGTYIGNRRENSIGVSLYHHIWGWMGSSKCWEKYDWTLGSIDVEKIKFLEKKYGKNVIEYEIWKKMYDCIRDNPNFTWDYQFHICNLVNEEYSLFPRVNLVKNIGFDDRATHTKSNDHRFSKFKLDHLELSKHIDFRNELDLKYSKQLQTDFFSNKTTIRNIHHKIKFKLKEFFNK